MLNCVMSINGLLREEILLTYITKKLSGVVKTPIQKDYAQHSYYMYVIRSQNRDKIQNFLKSNDVATGVHFPIPLHLQPSLKHLGYSRGEFPISEKLADEILSIPCFPELSEDEINHVVSLIERCE